MEGVENFLVFRILAFAQKDFVFSEKKPNPKEYTRELMVYLKYISQDSFWALSLRTVRKILVILIVLILQHI